MSFDPNSWPASPGPQDHTRRMPSVSHQGAQPYHSGQPAPAGSSPHSKPSKPKVDKRIIGGGIGILVLGILLGSCGGDDPAPAPTPEQTVTQAPIVVTANIASSRTTHDVPSVSPSSGRNLLLCTVSKSSDSGGQTFSWAPPSGMTERTDAATNGYVTMTTATQTYDSSQPTGTRTFTLTTSAAATTGIGASIIVPSGTA